jgi:hypothetical protein
MKSFTAKQPYLKLAIAMFLVMGFAGLVIHTNPRPGGGNAARVTSAGSFEAHLQNAPGPAKANPPAANRVAGTGSGLQQARGF